MTQRLDHQVVALEGMRALGTVYGYISKSGLPKSLLDLIYLRASQINGCAYCISVHTHDLLKAGMPSEKLMLLSAWREATDLFSAKEQTALRWTEAVTTIVNAGVPEDLYTDAATTFSAKELVDLTIAVALINAYNRLAISFRRNREATAIA